MDWSENNACIKCDKGGNLLVCSENGCPLAVHEECLGCPARLDDADRFYCPYCLYKKAVAESNRAREQALARKKALLIFMDGKVSGNEKDKGENKTCEDNGHNQSKNSGPNVNMISCDDGKSKSKHDGIIDQSLLLNEEEKISSAGEDSEDSKASSGSEGQDPSPNMNGENGNRTAEEKEVREEELETSAEERIQEKGLKTSGEENIQEEERETTVEEGKIQEEESEASSTSIDHMSLSTRARAKKGSKTSKPVDNDSDSVSMQIKLRKQHNKKRQASPSVTPTRRCAIRSPLVLENREVLKKEISSSKRSRKSEVSAEKAARRTFGSPKRRRLLWTEEEEEALREGVALYSKVANINLPWRKILESSDKFHETRSPSDLKDKWRNMTMK